MRSEDVGSTAYKLTHLQQYQIIERPQHSLSNVNIISGHPKPTVEERRQNTKLWSERLIGKTLCEEDADTPSSTVSMNFLNFLWALRYSFDHACLGELLCLTSA